VFWLPVMLLPLVLPMFVAIQSDFSPGAGDNLVAAALLATVAEKVAAAKREGCPILSQTRLIVVSMDAEEAGFRGARAWVKAHRQELLALPTDVLNFECLYRARDVRVVLTDNNGVVPLSRELGLACQAIAKDLGYACPGVHIPLGGGGTDAAEFAKAGVRATTLMAMSTDLVRRGLVYHTPSDTLDALEPAAIEAAWAITLALATTIDRRVTTSSQTETAS
jgi:Zn-dependent M28 family amino/carboxypeptidase